MSRIVSASIPIAARLRRRLHAGHGGARPGASQLKQSALKPACLRSPKRLPRPVAAIAGYCSAAQRTSWAMPPALRMPMARAKSS